MLVKCTAETCFYNSNGMCKSESIEMIDFEYYEDYEGKKKDLLEDDMKCSTYKSKYRN